MRTEISYATETEIRWRGQDLMTDILGKRDFAETMYMLITGRFPEPWERKIFDACLITLMEHGLTPTRSFPGWSRIPNLGRFRWRWPRG